MQEPSLVYHNGSVIVVDSSRHHIIEAVADPSPVLATEGMMRLPELRVSNIERWVGRVDGQMMEFRATGNPPVNELISAILHTADFFVGEYKNNRRLNPKTPIEIVYDYCMEDHEATTEVIASVNQLTQEMRWLRNSRLQSTLTTHSRPTQRCGQRQLS